MQESVCGGSVSYVLSSSDDGDGNAAERRDKEVRAPRRTADLLRTSTKLSSVSTASHVSLPHIGKDHTRTSLVGVQKLSADVESLNAGKLHTKLVTSSFLHEPHSRVGISTSGETELRPGTQVLFQSPASESPNALFATPWELGRVIEILPASTAGKKTGSDSEIVIVERVTGGRPPLEDRVQTTRACVRRYSYEGSPLDVDDLCTLPDLSDAALLYALRQRFLGGLHYTFTGRMLLAVNPYERSVYPPHVPHPRHLGEAVKEALGVLSNRNIEGGLDNGECVMETETSVGTLPRPVALIVTGDSGAGKTETTKLVLHHLFEQKSSEKGEILSSHGVIGSTETVSGRILRVLEATNCLLESFGNALTPLNDNSSRFAKCVTVFLKPHTGEVVGANVECYLLEVSRLASRLPGESTFHILNMLFAERHGLTPEEKGRFDVWDPVLFRAMQSGTAGFHLSAPPYTLSQVRFALKSIGFSSEKIASVVQVLCGILHLLNIEFTARDLFAPATVALESRSACEKAADLLGFSSTEPHTSLEALLTTVALGKDIKQLHCTAAEAARDSTAKQLYESLFRYILRGINEALAPSNEESVKYAQFSVLDIFGFEVKDEECGGNDLEQLLINYMNEAVQHLYERTTFDSLRAEIAREGVVFDLPGESLLGQSPTFDLFVRRPQGVLNIINDDSLLAQRSRQEGGANLAALLLSLQKFFPGLIKPNRSSPAKVSIQHYCANVVYDMENMSVKNRVSTAADSICAASSNAFVIEICEALLSSPAVRLRSSFEDEGSKTLTPRSHATTLISQFCLQVESLMARLKACTLFWTRCIKPNMHKSPQEFNSALVYSQLKYGAILKSLMLFGLGYCHSFDYKTFVRRYLLLAVWGYCFGVSQCDDTSKNIIVSDSRGVQEKTSLCYSSLEEFWKQQIVPFHAAVYRASFREACLLVTKFVPCCMGDAFLLGSSKVFLRSNTLRTLLVLGKLAKEETSRRIGRVGRAFIERRSLAAMRLSYAKEKRLDAIRERIAKEIPEREALEVERESLLEQFSEGRAEKLASLSRQAMRSTKRVERHWKETVEMLTSELTKALREMNTYDEVRLRKEKEVREEAEMIRLCRARTREKMNREKVKLDAKHCCQHNATRENVKAVHRSQADIDAEREKAIREEVIKARQLQLRMEQEVLMEEYGRAARLKERRETRQIRQHLDKQQKRIVEQARLKEEVEKRHVTSQFYLVGAHPHLSSEARNCESSAVTRITMNETLDDYTKGGLVFSPSSNMIRTASYASVPSSIQKEMNSIATRDKRDQEVEWMVQKDMVAFWESLHGGSNFS